MDYRRTHIDEIRAAFADEIRELEAYDARETEKSNLAISELECSVPADVITNLKRKAEFAARERRRVIVIRKKCQNLFWDAIKSPDIQQYCLREIRKNDDLLRAITLEEHIAANTKQCPQCKVTVETRGGSNRLQCAICKCEFCWVCGKAWETHNPHWTCPDRAAIEQLKRSARGEYTREEEINLDDKAYHPQPLSATVRMECLRIQDYETRFRTHQQSEVFVLKDSDEMIKTIIKRLSTETTAENAKNLVLRLLATLVRGTSVIMWSYPRAYLMGPDDVQRQRFESDQGFLEIILDNCESVVSRSQNESYAQIEELIGQLEIQINRLLEDK
jgi:hypothetical protein